MRFLLFNNHCISDPTTGVAQSLRTIAVWLEEAGHDGRVLTTARCESALFDVDGHLARLAADGAPVTTSPDGRVVHYRVGRVPVALLRTRHNDEAAPDAAEAEEYLGLFDALLDGFAPELVIGCNGHPMIRAAFVRARRRDIASAFAVRSFGYDDRRYFDAVDHVFTCSRFLSDAYERKVGVVSTPLEPPIDWSEVVAPGEARRFVTFVHPAPHKGLFLFGRLADMLGARRPDIPVLIVQSGCSAGVLHAIEGLDLRRYPHIMAAPPQAMPADFFAVTRLLLVPSVWDEPFGRVAAEAMINGIPPLVSNRGALPDAVGGDVNDGGGGCVLPVPAWMTPATRTLPSEAEVAPWFDAICRLWDDRAWYDLVSARAARIGRDRYGEEASRRRHVDYFTALAPGRARL